MATLETIPGVNIQWPWSELLLTGKKSVETRSYPLPEKYLGQWLAVIETPGPHGKREAGIDKARITGKIMFSESFQYPTLSEWSDDFKRHRVPLDDTQYGFSREKDKWGWHVGNLVKFDSPLPAPKKKGIVFATECLI